MRVAAATIATMLVVVVSSPAGAQSGSTEPTASIDSATGSVSVETIGPDGLGQVPSPPIGPAWQAGLERSFWNVGDIDLVACDDAGLARSDPGLHDEHAGPHLGGHLARLSLRP